MRLLLIPLLSSLFLLFLSQASLAKGESYYYAKTYFSKVAVPSLSCPPGAKTLKNSGGITCQRKCENNMTQVGNFCEPNRSKRRVKKSVYACQKKKKIMGVETCTKRGYECRGGYKGPKKIGGLVPMCLSPCPENFRGTSIAGVPHCINRQGRYSVISLKATPVCNKSFDLSAAGTCLEVCKKNYSHVIGTNVCAIRRAPAGYSFCSFKGWQSPGFARGYDVSLGNKKVRISAKLNCEIMYASQIYTVQSLVSAAKEMACPPCKAQREGNKAALLAAYSDNIEDAKSVGPKLLRELDPLAKEIYTVVRKGGSVKSINMVKAVNVGLLNKIMNDAAKAGKFVAKTGSKFPAFYKIATVRNPNSYEGQLEIVRNAATIVSLFLAIPSVASGGAYPAIDFMGASMDTIATFAYPVWGKG